MRAVKLRAGKPAELADVKNTLKALQAEVDGPIEVIPIPDAQGAVLIVNEEGKLRGDLEYNRPIRDAAKNCTIDMIFGDALILGTDGEDFTELSEEDAAKLVKRYSHSWSAIYI